MIQPIKTNTRPVGFNRCIRDAMELKGLDLEGLSSLLGIDADKCQRSLDQEMIRLKKMSWLSKIFKYAYGDQAPQCSSLEEYEGIILLEIIARGPAWMEEPYLIEGSARYLHHQLNQYRPSRKKGDNK